MTLTEIVLKLTGSVRPIGKTEVDEERLKNLKDLCALVNDLVSEIGDVHYRNKDSYEHSLKEAADYAKEFLSETLGISE